MGSAVIRCSGGFAFSKATMSTPFIPIPSARIVWLKADAGVTYDESNLVSLWADQTEFGNNVTPFNAGYRPLFVENSINSLPTIRFKDSGDTSLLVTQNIFPVSHNTPVTLIAAIKASYSDVNPQASMRWLIPAGNAGSFIIGMNFGSYGISAPRKFSAMYGSSLVGEQQISGSSLGEDSLAILSIVNDGTVASFYENGSLVGTYNVNYWTETNPSNGIWGIGAQIGNGNVYLGAKFNLAELMIYSGAVNSTERETQEAYLNEKWAIY
jgi:hypothetical protein